MRSKTCPICGNQFVSLTNSKYCSDECRHRGTLERHKRFYERHRDELLEQRKEERAKARQERIEYVKQEDERKARERIQREAELRQKNKELFEEKLKNGYLPAVLQRYGKVSKEYWSAFQKISLHYYEKYSPKFYDMVNGISVFEPEFPALVVQSIKDTGSIFKTTVRVKASSEPNGKDGYVGKNREG